MIRLINEKGEGYVKALLTLLIIDTVDFLNIGKTMNNNQVMQTVSLILEDYWHYKVDHFVLLFNKAKKGYFGKQYDRIDGQVIFSWLEQFDFEFGAEVENERKNESKRFQRELSEPVENAVPMPDWFADSIKDISKKERVFKTQEISDQQKHINQLIKDFNKIYDSQEFTDGKRFIDYEGKKIDVAEYIQIRLNNL